LNTKSIPGGRPITGYLSVQHCGLEKLECLAQPSIELFRRNIAELRLRIVNIVDVDRLEPEVFETLLELVPKVPRRHTVAAADEVGPLADAGSDKDSIEIIDHLLLAARRLAVKRHISTLGADHELITSESSNCTTETALTSLKPVVRSGVENIATELD